jgi:hypothetical protein
MPGLLWACFHAKLININVARDPRSYHTQQLAQLRLA